MDGWMDNSVRKARRGKGLSRKHFPGVHRSFAEQTMMVRMILPARQSDKP